MSNSKNEKHGLSSYQQTKFLNYVDNGLMRVQRRWVRRIADIGSTGTPLPEGIEISDVQGYKDILELLNDLRALVDFVWYSITKENFQYMFGQEEYLLKILDDLGEYIHEFPIRQFQDQKDPQAVQVFEFLKEMDKKFCQLIDHKAINLTVRVRLESIADRSRESIFTWIGFSTNERRAKTNGLNTQKATREGGPDVSEDDMDDDESSSTSSPENIYWKDSNEVFVGVLERFEFV
ncbi:hypothetical protein NADFUDRAFT_44856 [Nadsonia fulvescens var. elongata DSM 6958]|uniref:Uncharacterized protein n=1 Tax=Nadsonia fulvescens var. elongata DSM 6958 TaxID=857566 RepID=A0A1E3PS43_9ASCO|nr:hypothetical protein NADFUDRAFT_44856 [Nadsonia fulvescens var. elongata DSM 6958]